MTIVPEELQDSSPELFEAMRCITELETLNHQLEATNRNYMEMLGFVAHELKNTLSSAVLSLYTVKDGYLGEVTSPQQRSLESVARSLGDLQHMIGDYLDLSRLEMGEMEIRRNYFPLNARVVKPVLEELEDQAERRQMVVENGIPDSRVVFADANLLKVVYGNLLSNAIRYGREGGMIRLGVQEDGNVVTLSVCNDSSGISPDQIPLLFKKFSRLHNQECANQHGTGLGLHICREVVEKHGGEIWAESQIGEWVRFSFTLPKEEIR
jgi:signal transduction histidine kinase